MASRAKKSSGHPPAATLPPALFHRVQDAGKNKNCAKFFDYWKKIAGTEEQPTDQAHLVEVKFYMHWPVCDPKLADPSARNKVHKTISGPLWFENPDDYLQEVPKKLGSGDWHVVLNELNVHGELMEAYFSAIDLDLYPPKIDLKSLVRGVKQNEDYIRWLAANNIKTPWDNPEEEDDMASSDALRIVAESLQRTTETAVNATQEAAEARVEAAEAGAARAAELSNERSTHETNAVEKSIELVTSTAKEMIHMYAANAGPQFNPIEMMKAAKDMMTPASDDGNIKMLVEAIKDGNTRMVEMQTKNIAFMETVLQKQHSEATGSSGPLGGLDSMLDSAEKLERAAKIFGWKREPGEFQQQNQLPAAPPGKSLMDSISENIVPVCTMITTVIALGANIVHNMRSKPGDVENPAAALQKAQANNPALQYQQQQAQQPAAQTVQQDPHAVWKQMMEYVAPTLEAHIFQADLNGYTFAEWVMCEGTGAQNSTLEGRRKYVAIREALGRPQFEQLIKEHNGLWSKLQGMPGMVAEFLDQFFGYDEWQVSQQQEGAAA